jgi:hypothetical protein
MSPIATIKPAFDSSRKMTVSLWGSSPDYLCDLYFYKNTRVRFVSSTKSYAGNTHYAAEEPHGEAHTLSMSDHLYLTNEGSAQVNHQMAANSSHKRHKPWTYGYISYGTVKNSIEKISLIK